MKNLVIVESPSKANTINKYLGNDFTVKATVGHIKNLPKKTIGIDIEKGFEPKYEIISGKEKTVEEIRKLAKNAKTVYLAPDPDREGEAIAWNIKEIIDSARGVKPDIKRVLFHEITKNAVINAINNPSSLNQFMYESQKARRILDRLVGYSLSPFLWDKVRRGLSAGRVQSIALYLIVEREKEIKSFKKEEYWNAKALFDVKPEQKEKKPGEIVPLECDLIKINGKDPEIKNSEEAENIRKTLMAIQNYKISDIGKKQLSRKPPLPFTTSTLQQEAAKLLRFPVKKTMSVAQKLYEGIEIGIIDETGGKPLGPIGLITYMRTDSVRISSEAASKAGKFISETFGKDYMGKSGNSAKKSSSGKVQDAHEAIRPTDVFLTPQKIKQFLTGDEFKLYNIIWSYFVASLMANSIYKQYNITIKGKGQNIPGGKTGTDEYSFKNTESVLHFDGFQKVINLNVKPAQLNDEKNNENNKIEEAIQKIFSILEKGDPAEIKKTDMSQHFTSPPPRYTEATLVKALDENGIGRPSTYQTIIANIKNKDYVAMTTESADASKKGGSTQKFKPTDLGITVSDILKEGFSDILDVKFTANLEKKLDEIENGGTTRIDLLKNFYNKFTKDLENAKITIKNIKGTAEPTDITCDKCGKPMVIKMGRFGKFLACSGYPECKNTKELPRENAGENGTDADTESSQVIDEICDKCGKPMVIKMGRFGKFLACSGYPECKNIKPVPVKLKNNLKISCPSGCGGYLVEKKTKRGRRFYSCSNYPTCKFASWSLPEGGEEDLKD